MIGVALNVSGILIGGSVGLARRKPLSPARESIFKVLLGAFTVFYGLRLTWQSLEGSAGHVIRQILIAVAALVLGKATGRLVGLQRLSNRLGQQARERITRAGSGDAHSRHEGFKTLAVLFCAAPLAILGAVQDGLSDYFYPLAIKGLMDGLATMGFVSMFGWGVLLAAVPVLAFEGTITLACEYLLKPFLDAHGLVGSVNASGGLLVFCVALVILGLKRVELADYLPSLLFAPALTWVLTH